MTTDDTLLGPPWPSDNVAHVLPPPGDPDLVAHRTDAFCPCDPSVHQVYSDNRDRHVGFVLRHHRNGIAEHFDRELMPAELARLLS